MKRTRTLPVLAVLAAVTLGGCATAAPTVAPTAQPAQTADTPSPPPPAEPAPVPSAPARGADTTLEAIDAYALCKAQTLAIIAPEELSGISWAPFESSTWLQRDDGAFGMYIEATNENRAADDEGREVALYCKVGGTLGEPDWLDFGVGSREPDRDALLDSLAATDQS
jgi:hypothetical protein